MCVCRIETRTCVTLKSRLNEQMFYSPSSIVGPVTNQTKMKIHISQQLVLKRERVWD